MEKFGTILCVIGLLDLFSLLGYGLYVLLGWIGVAIYTSVLCLTVGGSIIMTD